MADDQKVEIADLIADGPTRTSLQEVPRTYANGFSIGITNADVQLILQVNGQPVQLISMSYTLAKTLVEKLGGVVRDFETKSGPTLLTTDAVDQLFAQGVGDE